MQAHITQSRQSNQVYTGVSTDEGAERSHLADDQHGNGIVSRMVGR